MNNPTPFLGVYRNMAGELIDMFTGQVVTPEQIIPIMSPFSGVFLDTHGNLHDLSELGSGGGGATSAAAISFNNTDTPLNATSVQAAIVEIVNVELAKRIPKTAIVHTTGQSETEIMSQKAITDALNNNSLGIAQTVFFDDQIQLTPSIPAFTIETGVMLKDGADYQIVISAMEGTTGSSASVGNGIMPFVFDGNINTLIASTVNTAGILNAVFRFRWQMHPRISQPGINIVNAFPLFDSNTIGTIYYTSSNNMDVDTAGISTTYSTQTTSLQRLNIDDNLTPELRIGISAPPTANIRYMAKVIEIRSAYPTN